jgi:hypothetical protein
MEINCDRFCLSGMLKWFAQVVELPYDILVQVVLSFMLMINMLIMNHA